MSEATSEAPSLTPESNAPPIQSTAQTVLEQAQAQVAEAEASDQAAEVEVETTTDEGETTTKGLSWNDALKRVPPDIAKLMRNMQGDYTRKTQELADQRKELLREREALLKGRDAIEAPEEVPEYDPFDEGTINARIEREVARRLQEVLEPMQREYEQMAAEDSYQAFLVEHPEFKTDTDLRNEVQLLLEGNTNLDLETAYWAAKGRQAKHQAAENKRAEAAKRKAAKEAALKGTGSARRAPGTGRPPNGDLRRMSNADLLALAKTMSTNRRR
jgi:hypothetical protein